MTSDLEKVAQVWGATAAERAVNPVQGWLDSATVLEQVVQERQTGSPTTNWLVGLIERVRIPRDARWLSLGCGAAGCEIWISSLGLVGEMTAVDASPGALLEARRSAASKGVRNITFTAGDANDLQVPEAAFDVVMMNMSLHHVRRLATALDRVARALRPGGWLLLNEFVGPRQFQFTDRQLGLVRGLLAVLPDRLRIDSTTGRPKTEYVRMPVAHWNAVDPSEAIRSDRILDEVGRRFEIVVRNDYGGAVLALLLEHIVHNFRADDTGDVALIRLLGGLERALEGEGVLPSDYTVIAARPRPPAPSFLRRLLGG